MTRPMAVKPDRRKKPIVPLTDEQRDTVEKNLKLAQWAVGQDYFANQVKQYRDQRDAFQDTCVGLCKAVPSHNPAKGKLSTHAHWKIFGELTSGSKLDTPPRIFPVPQFFEGWDEVEGLHSGHREMYSPSSIAAPTVEPEEIVDEMEDGRRILKHFPMRHRKILLMLAEGETMEATGMAFGITKERVRQIRDWCRKRLVERGVTPATLGYEEVA